MLKRFIEMWELREWMRGFCVIDSSGFIHSSHCFFLFLFLFFARRGVLCEGVGTMRILVQHNSLDRAQQTCHMVTGCSNFTRKSSCAGWSQSGVSQRPRFSVLRMWAFRNRHIHRPPLTKMSKLLRAFYLTRVIKEWSPGQIKLWTLWLLRHFRYPLQLFSTLAQSHRTIYSFQSKCQRLSSRLPILLLLPN